MSKRSIGPNSNMINNDRAERGHYGRSWTGSEVIGQGLGRTRDCVEYEER